MTPETLAHRTLSCGEWDLLFAAETLKALAHPLRIKILYALGAEEACVQTITCLVGTSPSNVAQHVAVLKDQDLLLARRHSHKTLYRLANYRVLSLLEIMFHETPGSLPAAHGGE